MVTDTDLCFGCGGDGKITNSAHNIATCPMCRGSGRKGREVGLGLKDVTKTKEKGSNRTDLVEKQNHLNSTLGTKLEGLINQQPWSDTKKQEVLREAITFEQTKGIITETKFKEMRKKMPRPMWSEVK